MNPNEAGNIATYGFRVKDRNEPDYLYLERISLAELANL